MCIRDRTVGSKELKVCQGGWNINLLSRIWQIKCPVSTEHLHHPCAKCWSVLPRLMAELQNATYEANVQTFMHSNHNLLKTYLSRVWLSLRSFGFPLYLPFFFTASGAPGSSFLSCWLRYPPRHCKDSAMGRLLQSSMCLFGHLPSNSVSYTHLTLPTKLEV